MILWNPTALQRFGLDPKMQKGLHIFCANVVNIVNFLRRCGFSNKCITNLDNRYLWVLFNFVANKRSQPFAMYKVKAHCGKHDLCQDPFLTEGNSCADKLAKDTAWAFLEARQQTACEELAVAMSLQAHLVHTLATRSSLFKMLPAEIPAGQEFFPHYKVLTSSFVCSCAPKTRIFSKGSVCSGTCRPLVIRAGDAENMFISCVKRGEPISPFIRTRVSSHHNRYIAIAYPQEMWQPLVTSPDPAFLAAGLMRLSPSAAGAICEFFSQSAWVVGSHRSIHRTSWVEIMADFVFQFGYFPGFINQSMTLKVLVQRFKRAAMRLFQSHQLSITALRSTHLLSFGFCHVASLHISRSFHFPDHIFAFLMGCASRFAEKNNSLNFVPPLHEFFWLSDACIQIKWHSPTPSSPSFLAWRWLRCWRKERFAHIGCWTEFMWFVQRRYPVLGVQLGLWMSRTMGFKPAYISQNI